MAGQWRDDLTARGDDGLDAGLLICCCPVDRKPLAAPRINEPPTLALLRRKLKLSPFDPEIQPPSFLALIHFKSSLYDFLYRFSHRCYKMMAQITAEGTRGT